MCEWCEIYQEKVGHVNMDKLNYVPDGQISFADFLKPGIKEKPKELVQFINGQGKAQYSQIKEVIEHTCQYNDYDMPGDSIDRITNAVSVWLLNIGGKYKEYIESLMK